jgi:hypothetical protein
LVHGIPESNVMEVCMDVVQNDLAKITVEVR